MRAELKRMPKREEFDELKQDVKVVRAAATDTSHQVHDLERRVSRLEAAKYNVGGLSVFNIDSHCILPARVTGRNGHSFLGYFILLVPAKNWPFRTFDDRRAELAELTQLTC